MAERDDIRAFERRVKEILRAIERHEEAAVKAALELLDRTRRDVIGRIAEGGREFNLAVLRQVQAAIDIRVGELKRDLTARLVQDLGRAFDLGNELADASLPRMGTPALMGISRETVQVMAQYTATLITDVSNAALAKINEVLRQAVIGGLDVQSAIEAVGKNLEGSLKGVAARAETIVRTEVLRIQSIATQARLTDHTKAAEDAGYKLQKEWLSARDSRVRQSHADANGQRRNVDEPFDIAGEQLMYPRDPKGSAANTINCRCSSRPVVEKEA